MSLTGSTYLLGYDRSRLRAVSVRWCKTLTGELWHLHISGSHTTMCGHPMKQGSSLASVLPGVHQGRPCRHCVRVRERWYE